ncbi:hypothetical protein [Paenibacillus chungangensis]|uniref:Uncharacterized protein n=1 Tax=Paenibacillus chungangensis TaxID=696535 RepID=A0ABW3HUP5_9BACL
MEEKSFLYRHASVFLFRSGSRLHFYRFDKGDRLGGKSVRIADETKKKKVCEKNSPPPKQRQMREEKNGVF